MSEEKTDNASDQGTSRPPPPPPSPTTESAPITTNIEDDMEFFVESNKFKQIMFENLNGISAKFNIKYPINPKLTYDYSPINPIICQNIVTALYKYPKFYTQTLHLMNKMNLPCPLVDYIREPNYFPQPSNQVQATSEATKAVEIEAKSSSSSDESELETDYVGSRATSAPLVPVESETKKINVKSFLKSSQRSKNVDPKESSSSSTNKIEICDVFERDTSN